MTRVSNQPRRGSSRAAPPPALASRSAAVDILNAVVERNRPLDAAVEAALAGSGLEARDRAFARLLATTAIRRLGQIDNALAGLLDKPPPLRPAPLMNLLRIGAAQLLFLATPPHAAVASAVDLAQAIGLARGAGLANAVLRRLSREGEAIAAKQDAARLNTPGWLWDRWTKTYGEARARAIVEQHLAEPPLDFTVKPEGDLAIWAERLDAAILPTGTLRRPVGGRIEELPGFSGGSWWIQDAAASLPARLFGDLSGKIAYDLCAAPGGKTAQLAAAGAEVTAVDRSAARLAFVSDNLRRLNLSATMVAADALIWEPPQGPADAVLLDAPCTSTGTIRRHPDVKLARRPDDLAQLSSLQAALLARAARMVRPGGMLVYCTCSLEPEEGEAQIARLLAEQPDFQRAPILAAEIGGLEESLAENGDLRTLPCHLADRGGLDGFFAARLIRKP